MEDCLYGSKAARGAPESSEPVPMSENLVTQFVPVAKDNTIRIEGEKYACLITVEDLEGSIRWEQKST